MTEARLIDGKTFAEKLREKIKRRTADLKATNGLVPGLAAVLVGEDPASQIYVRNKEIQCVDAGMSSVGRRLPANISESELLATVTEFNADPAVNGILVQLPLPDHIDKNAVLSKIDVKKDVDGLNVLNMGSLTLNNNSLGSRMLY